jgi:hypothetical protein
MKASCLNAAKASGLRHYESARSFGRMSSRPAPRSATATSLLVFLLVFSASLLRADYIQNGDLSQGLAGWHGDGERAYLKADGTEGDENDSGVIPVIKLKLSSGKPREVSQDINLHEGPTTLHVKVDILASADFKRSSFPRDYSKTWSSGAYYWSALIVPTCDFWIRGGPGWFYKLADAVSGKWTTVEGSFDNLEPLQDRRISFCVPPGQGTLYLRNISANP